MAGNISIVYEDEALLAINKPAGLHSAPKSLDDQTVTVLQQVLDYCPAIAGVTGFHPWEPALLHRLDGGTSGILLLAKTKAVFEKMRQEFSGNLTKKEYLALVQCPENGTLPDHYSSYFLRCGPGGSKVKAVAECHQMSHGRKCTTERYETFFHLEQRQQNLAQVSVLIHRGFRHQIRVHLAANGYPIVGDELYNDRPQPKWASRMYLHAQKVEFIHPLTAAPIIITTAAPWNFPPV